MVSEKLYQVRRMLTDTTKEFWSFALLPWQLVKTTSTHYMATAAEHACELNQEGDKGRADAYKIR
jgi:hypothetical protein